MPEVIFDEPKFSASDRAAMRSSVNKSKFAEWLIAHSDGKIRNESQANTVMVAFAVVIFIISFYLMFFVGT